MPTQIVKIASSQLPLSVSVDTVNITGGTLAATQSGVWTVTQSGAWTVGQSGSWTVDLGSLNGASTAAKQPALGTAGTASADVLSVQGVASMTPLKTDGSATTQPVSGTVALSNTLGDMLAYTPTGSETGMVVRPLPNRETLMLVRQMQVIADEIRLLRRVFQDWSGAGEPRHPFTDNVNIVQ